MANSGPEALVKMICKLFKLEPVFDAARNLAESGIDKKLVAMVNEWEQERQMIRELHERFCSGPSRQDGGNEPGSDAGLLCDRRGDGDGNVAQFVAGQHRG